MINLNEYDKVKSVSIMLNVILIMLLCIAGLVIQVPCPPQYTNQVVQIDTIRPKDEPIKIVDGKPVIRKYITKKVPLIAHNEPNNTKPIIDTINHSINPSIGNSNHLAIYSDTLFEKDNYHAIINDTIDGEIIGRSVWFVNLKPAVTKTITNTIVKKEKVGIYIGALTQIDKYATWGIGPAAMITIPNAIAISYAYNINKGYHTAMIFAPIRFGKLK